MTLHNLNQNAGQSSYALTLLLAEAMEEALNVPGYMKGTFNLDDPMSIMKGFDIRASVLHRMLHRILDDDPVANAIDQLRSDELEALGLEKE